MRIRIYTVINDEIHFLHEGDYKRPEEIPVDDFQQAANFAALLSNQDRVPILLVHDVGNDQFAVASEDDQLIEDVSDFIKRNSTEVIHQMVAAYVLGDRIFCQLRIQSIIEEKGMLFITADGCPKIIMSPEIWAIIESKVGTRTGVH